MSTSVQMGVTYINQGAGQQINAESVRDIYYIHKHVRESVEAYALTEEEIIRLRAVYVRMPVADAMIEALDARNAVALIGTPGRGRRITSVAVIDELHATPHRIDLDPDDVRRDLPADPGCGYLVDIDQQTVDEIPNVSDLLGRYIQQLTEIGSRLIITATPEAWNSIELRRSVASIEIGPALSPVAIFRSHLNSLRDGQADQWAAHPDVLKVLHDASPADAVRLAGLANAVLTSGSAADPIREAVSAYQNWSEELAAWFKTYTDGYVRALLIAAATLDEADAASVFDATNHLGKKAELARPAGGGLIGNGIKGLLSDIEAESTSDGRVRFSRPAYALSVLDHVWSDRPQLRSTLRQWFADLPRIVRGQAAVNACDSVIELAIRQNDAALITDAVSAWAAESPELAAAALAQAGVAVGIGRIVRRTMYRWATRASTDINVQVIVADVCGGPFGDSFPRNAMTRLRHLAIHGEPKVQERVREAVQSLARKSQLRDFILGEVMRWVNDKGQLHTPGIRAFLALSSQMPAEFLSHVPPNSRRSDLLAQGMRVSLHDSEHAEAALQVCGQWLEFAAQGELPEVVVTDVIAGTCHNAYDIGPIFSLVWEWAKSDEQQALIPRSEIGTKLMQKLADRDPLVATAPTGMTYREVREDDK